MQDINQENLRRLIGKTKRAMRQPFRRFSADHWANVKAKIESGPLRKSSIGDVVDLRFLAIVLLQDILLLNDLNKPVLFSKTPIENRPPSLIIQDWYTELSSDEACSSWLEETPPITIKFKSDSTYGRVTTLEKVLLCMHD